ncbi:ATP-binding protein [Streptomyces sp. NPDC048111]|uniref:ATP-binding protein n=1 Tax=Streptomyces sp. NPDC048111 TaxID=3365500 RepID=UPI003711FB37
MLVIDSRVANVAHARLATSRYVQQACPWADPDEVVLVISELVGNAVRHTARGAWQLCLRGDAARLTADIRDSSPTSPAPRTPDLAEGGGMGWHIAERLTSRLTVLEHPDGKVVRAEWHASATKDRQAPMRAPRGLVGQAAA